ncbi:hypothetical protein H4R33_002134 [Dimargaris cristalligena]|uniref:Uncharacterized protein n=1 Tax=Dimargaris cristalligena TaxID=215637 RepID=A0A4P9ZRW9_9FUNG|nr:hypothetical protein H4R33_002134 [Dimargaris cristalligena]RKP36157.1 hypothetical protein BJ085DRAFT_34252 [Dimargaris cristalligena]|eukprot:RKP36157.1 hypothetical protein BJ085DRAFT_34252 [Dimargaris cristalligena]
MYTVSVLSLLGLTLLTGTTTALPSPWMSVTDWNNPMISTQANNHLQRRGLSIYKPKDDSDTDASGDDTGYPHPNAASFDNEPFSILDLSAYNTGAANQPTSGNLPEATQSLLMQSRVYIVQSMLRYMASAENISTAFAGSDNGLNAQQITEAIGRLADYRHTATRNLSWVNVAQLSDEQKHAVIPGFTLINQGPEESISQFLDFIVVNDVGLAHIIEGQVKPQELMPGILSTVFRSDWPYWDDLSMMRIWAVNLIITLIQTRQWDILSYFIGKIDHEVEEQLVYVWYIVVIATGLRNQLPLFDSDASFSRDMGEYLDVIQGSLDEHSLDDFIQCANDWNLPGAASDLLALGRHWEIPLTNRGLCPDNYGIPSTISFDDNGDLAVLVDNSFIPL